MFFKKKKPLTGKKKDIPEGLWLKCKKCGEILYKKELDNNLWVCPKCGAHFRISSKIYINLLFDNGEIEELDVDMESIDPLGFPKYKDKLKNSKAKTSLKDGVISGKAFIGGFPVAFAITDFSFMGGSMGSVVGEKIARLIRFGREQRLPVIILTSSGGGARMQEGIFSLMQMAKTSAELALLSKEGIPYINILTHPTMAGVMASFASLGDIIIAEPEALLGFTGPRVIEQTIRQKLPPGFQRSEFLLEHGMIDMVVSRKKIRGVLISLLRMFNYAGFKSRAS